MNDSTTQGTARVLQRLTRALNRHLPAAVGGDRLGVHQARVASRRLREAVPVLSTGLSPSKAHKAMRKIRRLTRALGTVRELDVTLHLLDEFARKDHIPRSAVEDVRAHVLGERARSREVMVERLGRINRKKLNRRLASVCEALDEAEHERWREALASRLLKRAKRLRAAIDEAGQMYAPERLHQVRIASKKLRYGLELAAESGGTGAQPLVRTIKRAQDLLGRLHDQQILQNHVSAVQAEVPGGARQTGAGGADRVRPLETLARHIEEECRRLHGRYVAAVPALKALSAAVPSDVVPLLAHPARRRPLKMTRLRQGYGGQGGSREMAQLPRAAGRER